jgi:hypothetical protein
MNYGRIVIAGVVATVMYFLIGGMVAGKLLAKYYLPYTGVYRPRSEIMGYFPIGIGMMLLAMIVLATIYAHGYKGGSGSAEGARFGLLVGLFVAFAVVGDEYVTMNIGKDLAVVMALGRLFVWVIAGTTIGLIYKARAVSR